MRRFTCLWALLCGVSLVQNSEAWVQTQRPGVDGDVPLAWDVSCFHYSLHEDGSDDVDIESLKQLTSDSFDAWQNIDCSFFEFVETELAQVDEIGLNVDRGNVNLLVWREEESEWPTSQGVAALTTTSYDETDGEILDSDIEFNGVYFQFGNLESYPSDTVLMDLQSTITHEIGHMIGLDHSEDPQATMNLSYLPGETDKRTLEQDDIDGICSLYPLSESPESCEEPYCGLNLSGDRAGCPQPSDSESCNCSAIGRQPGASIGIIGLLL